MKSIKTMLFALLFLAATMFAEKKQDLDFENTKNHTEIVVAVAANFKNPMEEIRLEFLKDNPKPKITLLFGASGQLSSQIRVGAPVDLFLSADMDFPEALYREGFTKNKPKVYATGKLVIMSQMQKSKSISMQEHLLSENTKYIAIANPKTAPYGRAAIESLKYYGIYEKVKDKLVFGESITQVNQFILTGSADFGFTSLSTALTKENTNQFWENIDSLSYTPIHQGAVIIETGKNRSKEEIEQVQSFFDYLFSKKTKFILSKYGYTLSTE
ncbi:molybdate ABC transporter substrate-binding protein [Leptospira meyeri]|uniref:molybdate ABC transporter substrate-binding protein n=1 Tax=Leptospira meyeri TaxID=29508 RepID=UPI00223DCAB6|nr:molybdate ABC transporter substrate-binding protein [Leptospira meyeri]MCW7487479.1 molybdate ABC transporter substrate-binding protein [Leptospira meyeri]